MRINYEDITVTNYTIYLDSDEMDALYFTLSSLVVNHKIPSLSVNQEKKLIEIYDFLDEQFEKDLERKEK